MRTFPAIFGDGLAAGTVAGWVEENPDGPRGK